MTDRVRIAVQKNGRLSDESTKLLKKCGISFNKSSDKLFLRSSNMMVDILMVRDDDIPKLVHQNIADLGIVGENVLKEKLLADKTLNIERETKLGFSKCRLAFAKPKDLIDADLNNKNIATSYPAIVEDYLSKNSINAEIVEIHGSVELTPFVGISDMICDLVSTGITLESNNLEECYTVLESQALLIKSSKIEVSKSALIKKIVSRINSVIEASDSKYIMFNADSKDIESLVDLLPAAESPTVIPLANKNKVAIHSVCKEEIFWETIEALKFQGASSILVLPIEKLAH